MKKVIVAFIMFLSIGVLFSDSIFAQGKMDFCPRFTTEDLNLTEVQKQEIGDLRFEHQNLAIELHSKLDQNRLKLEKFFEEDKVNEAAVMDIVEENNKIHNQLAENRIEMRLKMNSILTPEQKAELKDRPGRGMGFGHGFKRGNRDGHGFGRGYGQGYGYGQGRHLRCPNF